MCGVVLIFCTCLAGRCRLTAKRRLQQAYPADQGSREDPASHCRYPQNRKEISDLLLIQTEVIFFSMLQCTQVYRAHKDLQRWLFDVVMQL